MRRRARISETLEKFSVIKALQAIEQAHVTVLVLDAQQGISDQDASLLGLILDRGRALTLAVNKWDHLDADTRARIKSELDRRLTFIDFAKIHFISALHGTGVGELGRSQQGRRQKGASNQLRFDQFSSLRVMTSRPPRPSMADTSPAFSIASIRRAERL